MRLDSDKATHPEEREIEEGRDILIVVVFGKCFHNVQSIATSASQGEKSRLCRGKKEQVKDRDLWFQRYHQWRKYVEL